MSKAAQREREENGRVLLRNTVTDEHRFVAALIAAGRLDESHIPNRAELAAASARRGAAGAQIGTPERSASYARAVCAAPFTLL